MDRSSIASSPWANTLRPLRRLRREVRRARHTTQPWVLAGARGHVPGSAVALTFDDGPHPTFTNRVLDVLAEYETPATFFVVGTNARRHPSVVRRILDEGHVVASHSLTHPDPERTRLRPLWRDYRAGHLEVSTVAGFDVRLFRPPKGHLDHLSAVAIRRMGVTPYLWSLDAADWEPDLVPDDVVGRLGLPRPGDVILLHDAIMGALAPEALDRTAMVDGLARFLERSREADVNFQALDRDLRPTRGGR